MSSIRRNFLEIMTFLTRLKNRTPVAGLSLASAWASLGGALLAGKQAFKNMVEDWG